MTEPSVPPSLPDSAPDEPDFRTLPGNSPWVPLVQVMDILHHPNFHWCADRLFADCKFVELRLDTRDNWCLVRDQNGSPVDLTKLRTALENPTLDKMNENPQLALLPVPPVLPDYPEDVPIFEPEDADLH